MANVREGKGTVARRPRWLDRRRMYTGGALMILAPMGLTTGCSVEPDRADADAHRDVVADRPQMPDGWVDPEVIAIAPPFDPGPFELPPAEVAIVPLDPGFDWPPDAIAIDAFDPGFDTPPEMIAIAPLDTGIDTPPEMIAIAPWDAGPDTPPPPVPKGYMEPCSADSECAQEFVCPPPMMCIVSTPGCPGPRVCLPWPCGEGSPLACANGSACVGYDNQYQGSALKVCVRHPGEVAGGFMARCSTDADCLSRQNFCRDGCPPDLMCVVAVDVCLPIVCDPAAPQCPEGSTCESVGITNACVKNS